MPGPRTLQPQIVAFPERLVRGALVVLPGRGEDQSTRILRFQYNPESITRNRTGEWDANKQSERPRTTGGQAQGGQRGAGLFAKSETLSMKLVFDVTEALLRGGPDADNFYAEGVLPELAVLELAALGGEAAERPRSNAGIPNTDAHPREMLLVLGNRYFPIVITAVTITEKRFNPDFVPVRAEVDLQMRVIEAREVQGNALVKGAFDNLLAERQRRADQAWSVGPTVNIAENAFSTPAGSGSSTLLDALQDAVLVKPAPGRDDVFTFVGER
jgi:hypothetical protein